MTIRKHGKTGFCMAILLLAVVLGPAPLMADSMRCGQKVVRTGDSPSVLLDRCGEPRHRGKAYAEIRTEDGLRRVRVDQWYYKRSERSLERIVLIYRGEIVRVETGGR